MKLKRLDLSLQWRGKTLRFVGQSAIGTGRLLHDIEPLQGHNLRPSTIKAAE